MGEQQSHRAVAAEGRLARQALVQHAAQRVEVGAPVDLPALDLLRSDVLRGAEELAALGQAGFLSRALGEPEVRQVDVLAPSLGRDEDVARLHIAVHQPALVGGIERGGHLVEQSQRPSGPQASLLGQHALEIAALHVAHGDVEHPVDLTRLEDRDHVGVIERGGQLRLPEEALPEALVPGQIGGQQLQRHPALQAQILGQIDVAHPTPPEQRLDPVARKLRADTRINRDSHEATRLLRQPQENTPGCGKRHYACGGPARGAVPSPRTGRGSSSATTQS